MAKTAKARGAGRGHRASGMPGREEGRPRASAAPGAGAPPAPAFSGVVSGDGDAGPSSGGGDGRAAPRIGVVDVGSNSIRLVVFEGGCRSPAVVFNEKALCGLGARLAETGRLDPDGVARARRALGRFAALARQFGVFDPAGVATAAVREAADGAEFRDRIAAETGIRLAVASGADEARLAAQGVLFGNPRAEGVVADLGGASLELARVGGGAPGPGITLPLGPQRLAAHGGDRALTERAIRQTLGAEAGGFRLDGRTLYLVGGAWRALAKAEMARRDYPLKVLHEFSMSGAEARDLGAWTARSRPEKLAELPGVSANRVEAMPLSGRLLAELVGALAPGRVTISAFGLREGVCLERMAPELRAEDALMAAAIEQERRRARAPGFGAELGPWVADLLGAVGAERRLILAAAHLADVNWRTHPDYRTQGCWETVTRSSITDIGHEGRAFLGAALVARHSRKGANGWGAMRLLGAEAAERARITGLALRLGAVVAGSAPGVLGAARLSTEAGRLTLSLDGAAAALAGEEVERRLAPLARALDLEPELQVT